VVHEGQASTIGDVGGFVSPLKCDEIEEEEESLHFFQPIQG
jgi:hypothetical protein